ncbi:DUF4184 family protein [Pedobacter sp. UYP30]|uniref:DUF4184 family protein n=1 Tax=Pedobacter sp. UYP30 TaxID=1756400 RepID=UPI003398825C
MPFTFSHPAVVLPLTYLPRKWFSLTGLVIGSLTPDFEYFLRMKVQSEYSHTLTGLFWFDLPLGILLAFAFHNIVKADLFDNLPKSLKNRLYAFKQFDWNKYFKQNIFIVLTSIIIGAFSHILWDSFTHETGFIVNTFRIMTNEIHLFGRTYPVYKISQHLSTLIGGIVVLFSLFNLNFDDKVKGKIDNKYWILVSLIGSTIFLFRFFSGLKINEIGNIIVTGISAVLLALILTPTIKRQKYNWW